MCSDRRCTKDLDFRRPFSWRLSPHPFVCSERFLHCRWWRDQRVLPCAKSVFLDRMRNNASSVLVKHIIYQYRCFIEYSRIEIFEFLLIAHLFSVVFHSRVVPQISILPSWWESKCSLLYLSMVPNNLISSASIVSLDVNSFVTLTTHACYFLLFCVHQIKIHFDSNSFRVLQSSFFIPK